MKEPNLDCPKCGSDKASIKAGSPRGKQRYKCKECNIHYTTFNRFTSSGKGKHHAFNFKLFICETFEKLKKEGYSVRKFAREYSNQNDRKIRHSTILYWLGKYEVYKKQEEKRKGSGIPF